jgi:hypothetical protein
MYASYFATVLGENATETSELSKIAFWRADSGKNTSSLVIFQGQSSVTYVEDAEYSGCPSASRTDENEDS